MLLHLGGTSATCTFLRPTHLCLHEPCHKCPPVLCNQLQPCVLPLTAHDVPTDSTCILLDSQLCVRCQRQQQRQVERVTYSFGHKPRPVSWLSLPSCLPSLASGCPACRLRNSPQTLQVADLHHLGSPLEARKSGYPGSFQAQVPRAHRYHRSPQRPSSRPGAPLVRCEWMPAANCLKRCINFTQRTNMPFNSRCCLCGPVYSVLWTDSEQLASHIDGNNFF